MTMWAALLTSVLNPQKPQVLDIPDNLESKQDYTSAFIALGALVVLAAMFYLFVKK
jgi:hypothetical protein